MSARERRPHLSRSFASDPTAPAEAREALDELVGVGFDSELQERSKLVLTELVTNSVLHAGLTPADRIGFEVALSGESLCFEITDDGPGFEPVPVASKPDQAAGGWGLWLVEKLTDRWGVDFSHSTRVWCEFDLNAPPRPITLPAS